MTALSRRQFTNNASSVLAAPLASGATSLQVSVGDGAKFPQPSDFTAGYYIAALEDDSGTLEFVEVTARVGDTMTIVREQEGTTSPASFPATTTRVELRNTASTIAEWLMPSFVRYLTTGLGLTFEGPLYPGAPTDIAGIQGVEDPNRAGKLLLDIFGSADADVRVHADGRQVRIQDVVYPDGQGSVDQVLVLTSVDTLEFSSVKYQIVDSADVKLTLRSNLKFDEGFTLTDDVSNDRIVVSPASGLVGVVYDWAGSAEPTWGLFCDGRELDGVTNPEYAELWNVIGTTYGGANQSAFNIPDLRGLATAGRDDMGGVAAGRLTAGSAAGLDGATLGASGGDEENTLTINEMPAHTHSNLESHGPLQGGGSNNSSRVAGGGSQQVSSTGGGGAHANVQPTMVLNKVIRFAP